MDRQLIEEYVACGTRLRQAVAGVSPEESTARPGPGDWSILELVIHLTDSDSIAIDRMKRMLTEDDPPLLYADETAYVRRLASHEQSLEDALTLFEVGRRQFARVLRALPDEAFDRRGMHNRRGVMTVGGMVKDYIEHVDHHLGFLAGKRARLRQTAARRNNKETGMDKVNLSEKFGRFTEPWQPKIVGELNGQQVKLVKFQGPFVWHHHDNEDELFLVVKGRFRMEFRDRHVWLEEGEFQIVPRGVEHRPVAEQEAHVLLFEPASTLNTGNVRNERTVANLQRI